jgi:hypothetical protein
MNNEREPRLIGTDPDGSELFAARTPCGKTVILDRAGLDRLSACAIFPRFHYADNGRGRRYVRVNWHGKPGAFSASRFIARALPRESVGYRDGNHLNLRTGNLVLTVARKRGHAGEVTEVQRRDDFAALQQVKPRPDADIDGRQWVEIAWVPR